MQISFLEITGRTKLRTRKSNPVRHCKVNESQCELFIGPERQGFIGDNRMSTYLIIDIKQPSSPRSDDGVTGRLDFLLLLLGHWDKATDGGVAATGFAPLNCKTSPMLVHYANRQHCAIILREEWKKVAQHRHLLRSFDHDCDAKLKRKQE